MARRVRREEESFQMAPMIDMVFLLLVFFMTVSTIARDARPEVELPLTAEGRVPVAPIPRPVLTLLREDGNLSYAWFNRRVGLDGVEGLLREAAASGDDSITIRAAADCRWAELQPVLAAVRGAGFREWVLCGFED